MATKTVTPKPKAPKVKDHTALLRMVQETLIFLKVETEQGRLPYSALAEQLETVKAAIDAALGE